MTQYMGSVQGKSLVEVLKCATALDEIGYMTTLGVPRCLNRIIHKSVRQSFLEGILPRETLNFVNYHCQFWCDQISEIRALANLNNTKFHNMDELPDHNRCVKRSTNINTRTGEATWSNPNRLGDTTILNKL